MSDKMNASPRREFMRNVGAGAMAVAATVIGVRAGAESLDTGPEDEAWLNRITGKHRQVFDVVTPNDGWGVVFATNFLDTTMKVDGLKQSDVTTVLSLRHMATPLALNDAMWSKYKLGAMLNVMDKSTHAHATRNVFSHLRAGDMPMADAGVAELLARGAIVTACNVALTAFSGMAAAAAGLPPQNARAEWVANLIPGVVVVPAGVVAVNRAQEHHCTYSYGG